jgi:hypothetical protein
MDLRGTSERCGITVRDSQFVFRAIDGWAQGILIADDGSGAEVSGVHVENCTFVAPKDGKASMARLSGPKVKLYGDDWNRWVGDWENPVLQNGAGKVVAM